MIPGRDYDRFGVGWYFVHISSDLKDLLGDVRADPKNEQGVELFYNLELTPAAHLTADLQFIIDPFRTRLPLQNPDSRHLAIAGGLRLQIDF